MKQACASDPCRLGFKSGLCIPSFRHVKMPFPHFAVCYLTDLTSVSLHISPKIPASKQMEKSNGCKERACTGVGIILMSPRYMEKSCCKISHTDPQRERIVTVFNTRCISSSPTSTRHNIANTSVCYTFLVCQPLLFPDHSIHTALCGWCLGEGKNVTALIMDNAVWLRSSMLWRVNYKGDLASWCTQDGTRANSV